jgi:hypothetical protein
MNYETVQYKVNMLFFIQWALIKCKFEHGTLRFKR